MSPVFHPSAMIFSAKSFLAAMLALYIALSLGLESPSWAIITAYAVAQPRAGAVLSKGFYRMAGTIAGAAMSVFLVPPLVDAPELLSAAVACWLGLCVFLAAIDRTPRSYMFVLAGYSTCIIVFPSVSHPDAIFNIAVLRVQEIGLGVICSSLIHATILPSSSTGLLLSRLDSALSDAARWTADALSDTRPEALDGARRRLAMAVNEMHDILIHAGFESDNHSRQRRLYRALLLQIERLLPLSEALDDRILALHRTDAMTPEVAILLADVRAWISATAVSRATKGMKANQLRERCAGLEPTVLPKMSWQDALRLNLLARLSDLIAVYDNCIALRCAIDSWPCDDNKQCQVNSLAKSAPCAIDRNYYGALA